MKLAVMQPYFFPYIGYWQLMHAVDSFVFLDDVQYIRHGWVNRNRILKPGGGWQYVTVPVRRAGVTGKIRETQIDTAKDWRPRILAQLDHYRKLTRHFVAVRALVQSSLEASDGADIGQVNYNLAKYLSRSLGLSTELMLSSEMGLDYSDVNGADEWALRISQQMGAQSYINPIGGSDIFCAEKYANNNVALQFLKPRDIAYSQHRPTFEPSLSIIDVLMFNGIEGTCSLLPEYELSVA